MSRTALKRLVGTALVDRDFCEGLLNGRRLAFLTGCDLTDDEVEFVVSIKADSIFQFVERLCEGREGEEMGIPPPVRAVCKVPSVQ